VLEEKRKTTAMCFIECKCRSVRIEFPGTSEPLATAECCCRDCHARLVHLADQGGPELSEAYASKTQPLVAHYVENCMTVKGKERLRFFKLRSDDAGLINMACADCSSFLLGQHPVYNGNVVFSFGKSVAVNNSDFPRRPYPTLRWWIKDWPDEKIEQLHPLPGFWLEDGVPCGNNGWETAFPSIMRVFNEPVQSNAEGETFNSILASHKGEVDILDSMEVST